MNTRVPLTARFWMAPLLSVGLTAASAAWPCSVYVKAPEVSAPNQGKSIPANLKSLGLITAQMRARNGDGATLSLDGGVVQSFQPTSVATPSPYGLAELKLDAPLEPNQTYQLSYVNVSPDDSTSDPQSRREITFSTTPAQPLPNALGTLTAAWEPINVSLTECLAPGICGCAEESKPVNHRQLALSLELTPDPTLEPYLPMTAFEVEVDGSVRHRAWFGQALVRDGKVALSMPLNTISRVGCEAIPHGTKGPLLNEKALLAQGTHTLRVSASVLGESPTLLAAVELNTEAKCAEVSWPEPPPGVVVPGNPLSGCGCGSAGSGALWMGLFVPILAWLTRKRPLAALPPPGNDAA